MSQRKRKPGRGGSSATASPPSGPPQEAPRLEPLVPSTPASPRPAARPARREPVTQADFLARYAQRAEERNAEARASLVPLAAGERPWPIQLAVLLCLLAGGANLVLYIAGTKVGGRAPGVGEMVAFIVIMAICGIGMWVLWYQAVLAFMVLLAIVIIYFALFLVEASNLLGVVYPVVIIVCGGFLFWKLVRVLARLQMPERRTRRAGA